MGRPSSPSRVASLPYALPANELPAIEAVGYEEFCSAIAEAIAPSYEDGLGVRITSEFGWVTARPR